MKKSMIGLSILAVGLLSACQKDDVTTPEKGGNADVAYATLQVKLGSESSPLSRSFVANTKEGDAEGTDYEKKVSLLQFFNTGEYKDFSFTSNPKLVDAGGGLYKLDKAFTKPAGRYLMAVGLNVTGTPTFASEFTKDGNNAHNAIDKDFVCEIDERPAAGAGGYFTYVYSHLVSNNGLAMTSAVRGEVVQPNVKETEIAVGKNQFDFDVERVVCKGLVVESKDGANFDNTAYTNYGVTLNNLTFAPVNGATKTYLFASNAGKRTMFPTDNDPKYDGFTSAIDNSVAEMDADKAFKEQHLVRLGAMYKGHAKDKAMVIKDVNDPSSPKIGDYYPKKVKKATSSGAVPTPAEAVAMANNKDYPGFYFLENSVNGGMTAKLRSTDGFWRLAYAKVYAKINPKKLLFLASDNETLELKDASESVIFKEGGKDTDGSVDKDFELKPGTFFIGVKDHALYASRAAAKIGTNAASKGQDAFCYNAGNCGYRILWNRVTKENSKETLCADTRRNNTYVLTIGNILELGFPHDPSDKDDPNLPVNPNDPTDPTIIPGGGGDGGTDEQDTYVKVTAQVLKWNVVKRGNVSLGGKN